MGRRKIPLELIADEKSRSSTFQRRKEGLKKKLYEFTTLCGIDACMIIYGPYLDGRSMKLDIWPPYPTEVKRIINKYYKSKGVEKKAKGAHDLAHFMENRKRKINDDVEKLRGGGDTKAMYPGWDHRLCHASYDQLIEILHSIDSRVDLAKSFTAAVEKEKQQLMKGGTQKMIGCTHVQAPSPQSYPESNAPGSSHHRNNMQLVSINHLQEPKPLNSYMPQNYMLDQGGLQTCPFDLNYRTSFTMMMLMDDDYHDGSSSSANNLQCTPLKPSIYYDPRSGLLENVAAYYDYRRLSSVGNCSPPNIQQPVQQQFDPRSALLENVRYNNYRRMMSSVGHYSPPNIQQPVQQQFDPRSALLENVTYNNYRTTSSVGHYSPPNIQHPVQQQFVQRPITSNATHVMMPSDHSPVNDYQLNENCYDFTNFQMKNKRGRY